ncbi:late sigma transcription factor [Synechococcus phage S-SSM4]|uniref:RNA polymerase sigma-like factor n=1 Tax=Synechococcus phage S-SSM4 TaxID=536466 RepID=M1U2J7_9CAUD|nr:late sigma transcription factor [Synechococcus phage S-SSM4]AGG54158.1 late transcription sigma factor [Synechococcus phage S-SSM4]
MAPKKKEHYLNNKEFLAELEKYRAKVQRAKEAGQPKPRVNNYIGGCFLKIATHLSYRPNFINYMYKDDMVCDGIENCIQYIDNFDPAKSKNPFAYFTQIVYFAFLRRIAKEKRQMEIRDKIIEKSGATEVFSVDGENKAEYNQIKSRIETNSRGY